MRRAAATEPLIRLMTPDDWDDVARIYREGIDTGHATFEVEVPSWEAWNSSKLLVCRLVAERSGVVVAWAALSPVSRRSVYRGVAEPSIYVSSDARGDGVGRALLTALVEASEKSGIWTLQTSIFPENAASIALHESVGFRAIGIRARVGEHHGRWRDTVLMERRSATVGI